MGKRSVVGAPTARAAYFEKMLKRLCTDIGPHPSGTRAYEQVAKIIQKDLARTLPLAFLDRYLDHWATVPRPEILHQGRRLDAGVAENCSGTSDAGFRGVIKRIRTPGVPYGIEDLDTSEVAAYISVGQDVTVEPAYLVGEDVLSLPRFVIGIRDVPFVDLLVKDRAEVQVRCRVVYAPQIPTYNIVGQIPGKSPDEIVVIAHADSLIQTEGANDNTATAIITMMLAHALAGEKPKKTLTFLITGSEEYGCIGARHYVRRRQVEGTAGDVQFVVNSDSLTYGPNLWTSTTDPELMEMVKQIHVDLDIRTEPIYRPDQEAWMNDAAPFREINPRVRGINFNSRGHDTLAANHTPADDAANVPRDCVETAFQVLRELIVRMGEL